MAFSYYREKAVKILAKIIASWLVTASSALASPQLVAAHEDWNLWCEGGCKTCAMSTVAGSDGGTNEDAAFLLVYLSLGSPSGVVSSYLAQGYRQHSLPDLMIDGRHFELFSKRNRAWAVDTEADRRMISAMLKGVKAIISGVSAGGEVSRKVFSLMGFSAIWRRALRRCRKE